MSNMSYLIVLNMLACEPQIHIIISFVLPDFLQDISDYHIVYSLITDHVQFSLSSFAFAFFPTLPVCVSAIKFHLSIYLLTDMGDSTSGIGATSAIIAMSWLCVGDAMVSFLGDITVADLTGDAAVVVVVHWDLMGEDFL